MQVDYEGIKAQIESGRQWEAAMQRKRIGDLKEDPLVQHLLREAYRRGVIDTVGEAFLSGMITPAQKSILYDARLSQKAA